jgi:hypothetical protein
MAIPSQKSQSTAAGSGAAASNLSDQAKFVKPLSTSRECKPPVITEIVLEKDERK